MGACRLHALLAVPRDGAEEGVGACFELDRARTGHGIAGLLNRCRVDVVAAGGQCGRTGHGEQEVDLEAHVCSMVETLAW